MTTYVNLNPEALEKAAEALFHNDYEDREWASLYEGEKQAWRNAAADVVSAYLLFPVTKKAEA